MDTRRYDAILFDLDGTLLDTHDLILSSHRYATREVLGREIPDEVLMAKVGIPLETQMADYTDDPSTVVELCRVYREHNARVHDEIIRGFEGVPEMLEELDTRGIPLGVVTSKRNEVARKGLRLFGFEEYMRCVVGRQDCPTHKPDPGPVIMGCELIGAKLEKCLYVGDSPFDIAAGNAAGCETAAVLWDMFSEERLRAEDPTYVLAAPCELLEILE